jgi:predicted esterase
MDAVTGHGGHTRVRRWLPALAFALALLGACVRSSPYPTDLSLQPAEADQPPPTPGRPVLKPENVFLPTRFDPRKPLPILLALDGVGGAVPSTTERLGECAARNGWVLVAPSIMYRDYLDPDQIRLDDSEDAPRLMALLASLRTRIDGVPIADRIFVYGFSRGGQLAHRLALFYPDAVASVAVVAAGAYTLPFTELPVGNRDQPLVFPFGVRDLERYTGRPFDPVALRRVSFWLGVGTDDTDAEQVPRAWDRYLGATRIQRAERFAEALQTVGAPVSLHRFAGAGHEETRAMLTRVCEFFASANG